MGKQKYTVAEPNFERQENLLNSINICYGIPALMFGIFK